MVSGSIEERIKKMKEAILTEAKQRASTIVAKAEEEADTQRARYIEVEKQKLHKEFVLLNKAERVKQKIEKSALTNRHRIKRMQVRYEYVDKLKQDVNKKLRQIVSSQAVYSQLLQKLIVQGMLRMMERNINVQLKGEHIRQAQKLFGKCENSFCAILEKQTGRQMESKLTISEYNLEESNKKILGGVFLRSSDGVIVCDNSLDSRVRLIFEQLLPVIRGNLFAKPEQKAVVKQKH